MDQHSPRICDINNNTIEVGDFVTSGKFVFQVTKKTPRGLLIKGITSTIEVGVNTFRFIDGSLIKISPEDVIFMLLAK